MEQEKALQEGFSRDGFITDQDCFSSVHYRGIPASYNGCGWIAAYNLRRALGQEADWDQIRREMDGMHRVHAPGPTLMVVMRAYLRRYVPQVRQTVGREKALSAAAASRAGIFRYRESKVPHFVCFVRQDDGRFRFFNVADGLEDCVMDMEQFGREHFLLGTVTAFTVD